MSRERYPSEAADQFQLRLPDGMRDEIKVAALANDRSMNAEIIARLKADSSSLRDQFAGQALAGMLASESDGGLYRPDDAAARAYEFADAMLKARQP